MNTQRRVASQNHMRRAGGAGAALLLLSISRVLADPPTEQVQRTLKDQGFYYGEISGQLDPDTTAAIRRFQIRNGLKVTGELDAETRRSLGLASGSSPPKPTIAPSVAPQPSSTPDTADLRDDSAPQTQPQRRPFVETPPEYAPAPPDTQPDIAGVFAGTPFEVAPPEVQQRLIASAQTLLARDGYYRSGVDGVFGPATAAALRAYQARLGLEPTGRLDLHTLGALGLLPSQNQRGFPPRRRFMRPPPLEFTPDGEPIYEPP